MGVEIRELAERVLFSPRLEDKLIRPARLIDDTPGAAIALPRAPERAPHIRMRGEGPMRLPGPAELAAEVGRGRLLHTFANHELLAMELMALCLLRFPDAPPPFRRQVAGALLDEQRHFSLYAQRMAELGVEFGDHACSAFFWDALHRMESPLDYVVHMALTLEQANLDFTLAWRERLTALQDVKTARILGEVHDDEVRHVAGGVRWFRRLAGPMEDEFERYQAALRPPMSPVRAKGFEFHREPRRRAGLSGDFIERLQRYRRSRGRRPDVYLLNLAAEDELRSGRRAYCPRRELTELSEDLAPLFALLASEDDVTIVPRPMRAEHERALIAAGLRPSETVAAPEALLGRPLGRLRAWGDSPRTARRMAGVAPLLLEPPSTGHRDLASKALAFTLRRQLCADSALAAGATVVKREAELDRALAEALRHAPKVVAKAGWSASGRRRRVLAGPPTEAERAFLGRLLKDDVLVVEPWLDRVLDLSVTLDTRRKDPVLELCRFLTDPHGRYRGHVLARFDEGVGAERAGWLGRTAVRATLLATARQAAQALVERGYRGPAGVDALIHRDEAGLRLEPLVEINPRFTMGHVARALKKRLAPGTRALWLFVPLFGDDGRTRQAAERLVERHPPQLDDRGHLRRGAVFTTDPESSRHVLTLLLAGHSMEALFDHLGEPAESPLCPPHTAR